MDLKEEFLYNVWQFKRWDSSIALKTTEGEVIEIISPGFLNKNSGPDFFNSKIKINEVVWVGNVEIHLKSSDWKVHKHDLDPAYKNIILHVVLEDDISQKMGSFPTLELNKYISKETISKYSNLKKPFKFIPCESFIKDVDTSVFEISKTALVIEKWEKIQNQLNSRLEQLSGNWEQLLFERVAYVFGLKINSEPFLNLAKSLNNSYFENLNLFQKEALIFGQAGFLNEIYSDYQKELKKEYLFLKHKWNLSPQRSLNFKFFRLRPVNFPTIRMSQWASFLEKYPRMFYGLKKGEFYTEKRDFLTDVEASDFWDNHFTFEKESKVNRKKKLSADFGDKMLINAIIPIHFLYMKSIGKDIDFLLAEIEKLSPENNSIVKDFKKLKISVKNAFDTQAFIFLEKEYCKQKKCLNCKIGNHILGRDVKKY